MITQQPETEQLKCPHCNAAISQESALCSACGTVLVGVPLSRPADTPTQPLRPTTSQPLPQEQPIPTTSQPLPTEQTALTSPAGNVVIHNYPGKPPAHKEPRPRSSLWLLAFPALGVILILGLLFILFLPKDNHPVVAAPTATAKPMPTATPIPQAHVVIRLLDVACTTTRDFFSGDSFYIKSSLSAPAVGGGSPTIWDRTTNHYTINDKQKRSFGAGDQVIFDANVPLQGRVTGSLTAYADNEAKELDTTSIQVSATDGDQTLSWTISGRSFLNTWSYSVDYSTSITRLAQAPEMGSAFIAGGWLQVADTPALQSRLA